MLSFQYVSPISGKHSVVCVNGSSPRTISALWVWHQQAWPCLCWAWLDWFHPALSPVGQTECVCVCVCVVLGWHFIQHASHSVDPSGIRVKLMTRSRVAWRGSPEEHRDRTDRDVGYWHIYTVGVTEVCIQCLITVPICGSDWPDWSYWFICVIVWIFGPELSVKLEISQLSSGSQNRKEQQLMWLTAGCRVKPESLMWSHFFLFAHKSNSLTTVKFTPPDPIYHRRL